MRHLAKRLIILLSFGAVLLVLVIGLVLRDTTVGLPVADWIAQNPTTTARPLLLDLNTATSEELQRLPSMTTYFAEAIVEYRTRFVRFRSVEELRSLPGVDDDLFYAWRPYLTVS